MLHVEVDGPDRKGRREVCSVPAEQARRRLHLWADRGPVARRRAVRARGRLRDDNGGDMSSDSEKTAAARRRARAELAHGEERAGARSHFRAMGIDPDRLDGAIVGIASMWTQTMPCNLNHRDLAAAVEAGSRRRAASR